MKIIPTKHTKNVRMKQVGDAVTQNDPVAHARVRQLGAQQSTVLRAGARQNTLWRYDARVRTQVEFQHCTVNKRVDEKVDSNRLQ